MPTQTSNEEKIMPEVEVTASASFEDLLKLPDGQAVVVDVAKIRQALHSQKERVVEMCEKLEPPKKMVEHLKAKGLSGTVTASEIYKVAISDLKTKIEEEI